MLIVTDPTTTMPPTSAPGQTTSVTLNPPGPIHGIPGDATDPADFYGILLALAGMALAIVLVRVIFRNR